MKGLAWLAAAALLGCTAALKRPSSALTAVNAPTKGGAVVEARPSIAWAIGHNWLYFLSLGLCIPVLPRVIASVVNEDGSAVVSALSSRVGGDVEGVDKILTFLCVGALGCVSDRVGRKPLIALSSLGYAATIGLQMSCSRRTGVARLFLADGIDGMTSCMSAICGAYVADAMSGKTTAEQAVAVGTLQGLSAGGAFIVGFPLSAMLSTRGRYRRPMALALCLQLVNCLLALFLTPESLRPHERRQKLNFKEANPVSALARLFKNGGPLLRGAAFAYAFVWLGNLALNTTFVNYVNFKFGWGPQQAGPLLVVVGLMLAIIPRLLVPRTGTDAAIKYGALVFAASFVALGKAATGPQFVAAIVGCGVGCVALPALVSLVASQAAATERGAVLGGLQTLQELCAAAAYPIYGRVFANAIDPARRGNSLLASPAAPFYLAATFLFSGCVAASLTLRASTQVEGDGR
ncbi:major facilitator superfamily domain-containing protein [Pelagophyceae sp. CCMP2097]|nr:major facilitator superfamily domain-containing protein [Pelagophyceae sp. CCMP2097]|mmetsp:Transcript_31662/g.106636  ORF Transcript_31662/g.106636 Transcript_31662/m.106636 type:complete len:463 (-) Transcript_31662:51-1439(-)